MSKHNKLIKALTIIIFFCQIFVMGFAALLSLLPHLPSIILWWRDFPALVKFCLIVGDYQRKTFGVCLASKRSGNDFIYVFSSLWSSRFNLHSRDGQIDSFSEKKLIFENEDRVLQAVKFASANVSKFLSSSTFFFSSFYSYSSYGNQSNQGYGQAPQVG